jgi:hypothetical protein
VTTLEHNGEAVHVAYARVGSDFTLALAASATLCSRHRLKHIAQQALASYRFVFGALHVWLAAHKREAEQGGDSPGHVAGGGGDSHGHVAVGGGARDLTHTKETLDVFFRFFFRDLVQPGRKTDGLAAIPDTGVRFDAG